MPATYHIDAPARLVVITWSPGTPQLTDWTTTMTAVMSDPAFEPGFSILSDWREAVAPPDRLLMETLVDSIHALVVEGVYRWATVTPRTKASVGAGRMAELLAGANELPMRVFQEYAEAHAWLCDDLATKDHPRRH